MPRGSVLVVEDSLAVAKRLQLTLDRAGYHVFTARNGSDALKLARRRSFDLVITDEQMPIMSGRQLCVHLRAEKNFSKTPIIFLTGDNDVALDKELTAGLGIDQVFRKPFNPIELVRAVEVALSPACARSR